LPTKVKQNELMSSFAKLSLRIIATTIKPAENTADLVPK